ncbi:hypothetical protein T4B_10915 [Trichinella pseudospiralis]|uniref:Uncharacterized protein n=1 Tax=Trichinella pseudospiralis TaxID=6337 RepID=A0A0V1JXT1_TRIPS|nr:hypothetical protein T4B_10915 [Trichinella pseudospiralis]KRZ39796.1 hypothetical protein T4C_9234 [Trichinella pseudospiralis]
MSVDNAKAVGSDSEIIIVFSTMFSSNRKSLSRTLHQHSHSSQKLCVYKYLNPVTNINSSETFNLSRILFIPPNKNKSIDICVETSFLL